MQLWDMPEYKLGKAEYLLKKRLESQAREDKILLEKRLESKALTEGLSSAEKEVLEELQKLWGK